VQNSLRTFGSGMEGKMSRTTRLLYTLGVLFLYSSGYFFTQAIIQKSEFDLLTEIDKAIPFMPEHVWIYHTLLPAIVVTMTYLVKQEKVFFNVFWSAMICALILNISYVLFPAFYPRPDIVPSTLSELLVSITHQIDGAHNTFPSGHVTFSVILSLGVFHARTSLSMPGIKMLYLLWTLGIMMSTLTLKQHFIVDVAAGAVLATISFMLVKNIINKHNFYQHN
jgi:membrane-associated phospholipid phosphatase